MERLTAPRMHILYDHQIFSYQKFGGASRYFAELMNVLDATHEAQFTLGVAASPNEYLAQSRFYQGERDTQAGTGPFLRRYARNEWRFRQLARQQPFDVLHATFYDPSVLHSVRGSKLVVTVLDMIPERFPAFFDVTSLYGRFVTRRWIEGKRLLCQRADAIIAISQSTKDDLVSFYGVAPERVTVVHLGNRLGLTAPGAPLAGMPSRYVLFVGTRNTYKNFSPFIEAAAAAVHADPGLEVVCIGGGAFSEEEHALLRQHDLAGRVQQRNVADGDIAACYAHAEVFVFPSLYEGFGIPILEAFSCGCPTLLARASCFPEIAGDAALYFDPQTPGSMAAALTRLLGDAALRDQLRARGRARAAEFTWERTTARTLDIYRALEATP